MENKKEITREALEKMLADYGHHMDVKVPVEVCVDGKPGDPYAHYETEYRCVLNNAMVYNPYKGGQVGMSSNEKNAENAMKFIKDEVKVYSSVFNVGGHFKIVD